MDLLKLIKQEDLMSFAENYNYKRSGFMGQALFAPEKTRNLKVRMRQLVEGGDLPVMAQVHAFDSEARIGERPQYQELVVEKLLIKEKLDQGERVAYFLDSLGGKESDVIDFIYDDAANLLSRVITRTEVANMEFLSTGKLTIRENNASVDVDFGYKAASQNKSLTGWGTASHDIIGDLQGIQSAARAKGWKVVRAITSSTIINYMLKNTAINGYFEKRGEPITESGLLNYIETFFGIEFVVNDEQYKLNVNDSTSKRFFKDGIITFLGTRGSLGAGLYAVTPEELELRDGVVGKGLCALTMWKEKDPCTTWTKASGVYLPVPKDVSKMFIATVTA